MKMIMIHVNLQTRWTLIELSFQYESNIEELLIKLFHDNSREVLLNKPLHLPDSDRELIMWPKTLKLCDYLPNWVFAKFKKFGIRKRAIKENCGYVDPHVPISVSLKRKDKENGTKVLFFDSQLDIDYVRGKGASNYFLPSPKKHLEQAMETSTGIHSPHLCTC